MFMTWLTILACCAPVDCSPDVVVDDGGPPTHSLFVRCVADQDAVIQAGATPLIWVTADPSGQHVVTVKATDDQALPKVWVGVRLTPVPAPLAAHIGENGVMIANVAKGSPADQAGVVQYDVVVGFNGKEITRPQDLTAAIAELNAGQAAKLTIVRQSKPQELAIAPVERAADAEVEWKYAEPQDATVDAAIKMYGRALQRDANGNWIMQDLGQLHAMPDVLKKLEDLDIGLDVDKLHEHLGQFCDPNGPLHNLDVRILRGLKGDNLAEDKDERVSIKIKVEDDGRMTTIETGTDGKIKVTHVDADGNESSATYDNADELEKADPEAFKCYTEHCVPLGREKKWEHFFFNPSRHRSLKLQHDFQVDIEKRVQEALDAARKARVHVGEAREQALKEYKEKLGKAWVEVRPGHDIDQETRTLMVRVNDDGSIKVVTTENGAEVTREFKSKDEFKAAEPDLYAQTQSLLE